MAPSFISEVEVCWVIEDFSSLRLLLYSMLCLKFLWYSLVLLSFSMNCLVFPPGDRQFIIHLREEIPSCLSLGNSCSDSKRCALWTAVEMRFWICWCHCSVKTFISLGAAYVDHFFRCFWKMIQTLPLNLPKALLCQISTIWKIFWFVSLWVFFKLAPFITVFMLSKDMVWDWF